MLATSLRLALLASGHGISRAPAAAHAATVEATPAGGEAGVQPLPEPLSASEIYSNYPYDNPYDIVAFVRDRAPSGDPQAALAAIDEFSAAYPM